MILYMKLFLKFGENNFIKNRWRKKQRELIRKVLLHKYEYNELYNYSSALL